MPQYKDFAIRISPAVEGVYPVNVSSPAGEGPSSFTSPFAEEELADLLKGLSISIKGKRPETTRDFVLTGGIGAFYSPKDIGKTLFEHLFTGNCLSLYHRSIGMLRGSGMGLRIKLIINPEAPSLRALSRLPWELMYTEETKDFLNLSVQTTFVRYLEVPRPHTPLPFNSPLRILVVISDPKFVAPLDLEAEKRVIRQSWGNRNDVQVDFMEHATRAKLQHQLEEKDYHGLHFMGHGDFDPKTGEGVLLIEKEDGTPEIISGTTLGMFLQDETKLRVVFLNACKTAQNSADKDQDPFAGVASSIVMAGIPAVVAMQFPISDTAAVDFATKFYNMLPEGLPIDYIVAEARKSISNNQLDNMEWATPVLFMRSPDGMIFEPTRKLNPISEDQQHILARLSGKVRKFWIDGKLDEDVPTKPPIVLTKEFVPDAVKQSWEGVVDLPELADKRVPEWKSISSLFDELDQSLLILGNPGYGKSVSLLLLAQELLRRHEKNPAHPVPVVLFLSTWPQGFSSLEEWIENEVAQKYKMSASKCAEWLKTGRLTLMLDGLDEVDKDDQAGCVRAINEFVKHQREYNFPTGLAVCCREEDYRQLPDRFVFEGAIKLLPLKEQQIRAYFQLLGEDMTGLQTLLEQDPQLLKEAESPLMLSMMSLAYNLAPEELSMPRQQPDDESAALKRRDILAKTYINTVFERKGKATDEYAPKDTIRILSCLAAHMKENHQSVFLIESLQPNWLTSPLQKVANLALYSILLGLPLAVILERMWHVSHIVDPAGPDIYQIVYNTRYYWWFVLPLWVMLSAAWGLWQQKKIQEGRHRIKNKIVRLGANMLVYFGIWALLWMSIWCVLWLLVRQFEAGDLSVWMRHPLVGGIFVAILYGIRIGNQNETAYVGASEALSWSLQRSLKGLGVGLLGGTVIWLVYSLIQLTSGSERAWTNAGFYLSMCGLLGLVFGGLKMGLVKSKSKPNEGIRLSLRNGILGAAVAGPLVGLIIYFILRFYFYDETRFNPENIAIGSFWMSVSTTIVGFFWFGGVDVLRHYSLRLIITLTQKIPLNLAGFLDYTANLILLQKVGGGYIFKNRLLQDHFAKKHQQGKPQA
jgi:DNA polymerase III delta prime subunit